MRRTNASKLSTAILSVVALAGATLATPDMAQAQAHRVDPSLQPIAADEPLPTQGFPPLPDRLDLPTNSSWSGNDSANGAPRRSQPAQPQVRETALENYRQVTAGKYIPPSERGHDYYKCPRTDEFASGSACAPSDPNVDALRRLGREPRLRDSNDRPAMPDAPQVVSAQQPITQDLSSPEDQDQQKPAPSRNAGSNLVRRANQMVIQRGLGLGQQLFNRGLQF